MQPGISHTLWYRFFIQPPIIWSLTSSAGKHSKHSQSCVSGSPKEGRYTGLIDQPFALLNTIGGNLPAIQGQYCNGDTSDSIASNPFTYLKNRPAEERSFKGIAALSSSFTRINLIPVVSNFSC